MGGTWVGFVVAAVGDIHKSIAKARKGDDALVTGGVFSILRHPNYTGEVIGWTCSVLAAIATAWGSYRMHLGSLAASLFGLAGIVMVLARATKNLESKQAEKYGEQDEYQKWIKKSWVGVTMK